MTAPHIHMDQAIAEELARLESQCGRRLAVEAEFNRAGQFAGFRVACAYDSYSTNVVGRSPDAATLLARLKAVTADRARELTSPMRRR